MTVDILKKSAKALLKGYWLRSVTAVMVAVGVSSFASILIQMALALTQTDAESAVGQGLLIFGAAVGSLLSAPVLLGFSRVLWLRTEGENPSLSQVLYLFGNLRLLFKYLALYITKAVLIFMPGAIVMAPVFVLFGMEGTLSLSTADSSASLFLALGCLMLVVIGIALIVIQGVRYSLCDYVFIKHSNQSVRFILRTCSKTCVPRFKLIVSLYFSFIGWFLLNATGFFRLYTTPYFSAALACAARQFMAEDEYNSKEELQVETI